MATLKYDKQTLIDALNSERQRVIDDHTKNRVSLRAAAVKELEEQIANLKEKISLIKAGQEDKNTFIYTKSGVFHGSAEPDTSKYDRAIKRLEMSSDSVISLNDRGTDDIFKLLP